MHWRRVVMALLVGGLAAAWWFLLRWHQQNKTRGVQQQGEGQIPLIVRHNGPELELRWNTEAPEIRNASDGKLTIRDGTHESRLNLDEAELRSGAAYYWPEGNRVGFKLEVAEGVWGSLETPAWEMQHDEPLPVPPDAGHDAKRHRVMAAGKKKTAGHADRGDGASKTAHAKHGKHSAEKIPSYWKMPADQ
jgi:hypothetical protein